MAADRPARPPWSSGKSPASGVTDFEIRFPLFAVDFLLLLLFCCCCCCCLFCFVFVFVLFLFFVGFFFLGGGGGVVGGTRSSQ